MPGDNRSSRVRNQKNLVDTVERSKSCDTISYVGLSVINDETFGSLSRGWGWLMMKLTAPVMTDLFHFMSWQIRRVCLYNAFVFRRWNEKWRFGLLLFQNQWSHRICHLTVILLGNRVGFVVHMTPVAFQGWICDTHWCDTMFVQWLGKKTKSCPCLSFFVAFFGHFESLAFFENERTKLTPKQSDRMFSVNLWKVQQLSSNFSKKRGYIN